MGPVSFPIVILVIFIRMRGMRFLIVIVNRLLKISGTMIKGICYPFHWVFPDKRFAIPKNSAAKTNMGQPRAIPKIIWQTNYTNKVSLPVYINYLFNRLLSLDWEYRYVSTEARLAFIRENATQRQIDAFERLTDGASQADFWRLFVLNHFGGVYMDIDAHIVWPLSWIVDRTAEEVILKRKSDYTNYFMASRPDNPLLEQVLDMIVGNIEGGNKEKQGVYGLTGPGVLNKAMASADIAGITNTRHYRVTCIQGNFTNEYFQYIDKPGSKWNLKKSEDLLKR